MAWNSFLLNSSGIFSPTSVPKVGCMTTNYSTQVCCYRSQVCKSCNWENSRTPLRDPVDAVTDQRGGQPINIVQTQKVSGLIEQCNHSYVMSPLFHTRNFKIVSITSLGSKVRFLFIPARSLVQRVKCFVSPRNYQIPCFQARCVLDSNLTAFFLGIFEPTFTTTRTNCLHKRNAKSVSSTIPKLLKLF